MMLYTLCFSWWWCHMLCSSWWSHEVLTMVYQWLWLSCVWWWSHCWWWCFRMTSKLWSSTISARWSCSPCPQYSPAPPPAPGCPDRCFIIRKGVARICLQHHDVIMMLVVMVSITMAWWWWCWKYLMWWWCCRWRWCFPSSWWCVKAGADDGDVMLELFEGRWAAHWSPETSYCWSPWWRFIYFSRSVLFY